MARYIIVAGVIIVIIGVILYYFPNAFKWLGRLPGDIRIEKGNTRFYFPIVTMILISLLLSFLINIMKRW